jgi:prolyl-tRNA synthetase
MKDAYSFDVDEEGMKISYQKMWDAYDAIFTRLKLNYKVVQGDTGAMGGKVSHEFMAMSEVGEGRIAYCKSCDYAATDEKADVVINIEDDEALLDIEKIYTPEIRTIEDLTNFLKIDKSKFGKAIIYKAENKPIVVLIPGNRELNETKLINYLKIAEHELEMADEDTIKAITNADKGFTGPIGLKDARLIVDKRITQMRNIVVGANETDHHLKNVNYGRDFVAEVVDDLLLVEEGDTCPNCGNKLHIDRGIEVGNIFQLGTKYSKSLNATFLDENGKERELVMGSYGVGVSRSVAAIVEQYHDENGIIWPFVVAPYHVIITIVNTKKEDQVVLGERLYNELSNKGIEVLLDDRNESAGVKFNDRDLIGIPARITVGKLASDGIVEFSLRKSNEKEELKAEDVYDRILSAFREEGFELNK